MASPITSSQNGAFQPPRAKPPVGSSAGPPGACMTPSSETNVVTDSVRMAVVLSRVGCWPDPTAGRNSSRRAGDAVPVHIAAAGHHGEHGAQGGRVGGEVPVHDEQV